MAREAFLVSQIDVATFDMDSKLSLGEQEVLVCKDFDIS